MQKLRAGAGAWLRQGGASRDWIVSVLIERPAEAANREGAYTPRVRSFLAILQGMERVRKASIGVPRCIPGLGRLFWWPDAGYPNWRQGSRVGGSAKGEGKSLPLVFIRGAI